MKYAIYDLEKNIKNESSTNLHHFLLENEDLSQKDIDLVCKELASRHDGYYIYWTAKKIKKANIEILQKGMIGCEDIEYVDAFIKDIMGFDEDKFYNDIIELNARNFCYNLALSSNELDYEKLENVIAYMGINNKDGQYMFSLAEYAKKANIKKLEDAVVASQDYDAMIDFGAYIQGVNVNRLQEEILKSGNYFYILEFAINVDGADVERLQDLIMKSNISKYIVSFARDVEGANVELLQRRIEKIKDLRWVVDFATFVQGADIKSLENVVVESNDPDAMFNFLCSVKTADKERLCDKLLETEDIKYTYAMICAIDDINYKKILKHYKLRKDKDAIKNIKKMIKEVNDLNKAYLKEMNSIKEQKQSKL